MCQLSESQITYIRNIYFFFHASLTLKSALERAEQATTLCLCEETSLSQMVMEENGSSGLLEQQ